MKRDAGPQRSSQCLRLACAANLVGVALACAVVYADAPYLAVWSDGTLTPSETPLEWIGQERNPSLGKRSPLWGTNPLRRLRTTALSRPLGGARVEFGGGDRLSGRVVEFLPAATGELPQPACLVVDPLYAPDQPTPEVPVRLRVVVERIRRVVWEERTPRPYQANTLYYRDGRQTAFRSLRWEPGRVRLLVEQGVETVAWDDLAEVQLAERDPWDDYTARLAQLAPDLSGKLVRFETTGGVRATTSLERLRATGDVAQPETQIFFLQPAWSLDALAIPLKFVAAQTVFGPEEVALSDFEPTGYAHRAALGGGWKQWRPDAGVQGDVLAAGGREYGWGFGVHAHAELQFDLPPWARAFQTQFALDRTAGDGGCVKAKVYFGANQGAGAVQGKPLFESGPLVGSAAAATTGRIELRTSTARPNRLVLVCDALPYDRPAESDPLDIRDVFDWLEPLVELDADQLKVLVARQAATWPARETGCVVVGPYGEAWRLVNHGYEKEWRNVVQALGKSLTIGRSLRVPADAESFVLRAGSVNDRASVTTVRLMIGGKEYGKQALPLSGDARNPPAVRFPVPQALRGRDVRCDFVVETTREALEIDVRGIAPVTAN